MAIHVKHYANIASSEFEMMYLAVYFTHSCLVLHVASGIVTYHHHCMLVEMVEHASSPARLPKYMSSIS